MSNRPIPRPYKQGALDGFCGLYALVNAVHYLCGPLSEASATALFYQLIHSIERHHPLVERIYRGTSINEVGELLAREIVTSYPIHRRRPFRSSRRVTLDEYWEEVQQFASHRDAIVLTAIGGHHDHWTLFQRATDRTLITYDSSNLYRLHRRFCGIGHDDSVEARHRFYPSRTYFLSLR